MARPRAAFVEDAATGASATSKSYTCSTVSSSASDAAMLGDPVGLRFAAGISIVCCSGSAAGGVGNRCVAHPSLRPAGPPRSRGRARRAAPHACLPVYAPSPGRFLGEELARELTIGVSCRAGRVVLEHRLTLHRRLRVAMVLRIRVEKTRSPKFSSRISIASRACSVRPSYIVETTPSTETCGLRFSRTIASVFSS